MRGQSPLKCPLDRSCLRRQGTSLDTLRLSLAPRTFEPAIDLSSLYVLGSRVRTRAGLRVLEASKDWSHLKRLTIAPALEIWDKAYDEQTGKFDAQRAGKASDEVSTRLKKEFRVRKSEEDKRQRQEKHTRRSAGARPMSRAPEPTLQALCKQLARKRAPPKQPPQTLTAEQLAEPFVAHARARVQQLHDQLTDDDQTQVEVAGNPATGKHSLGTGLARGQWIDKKKGWPVRGDEARQLLVRELQVLFDGLQARFPGRVTFTTQLEGARASSTRFLVWGAHARNWNLPDGDFIPGGGQAADMGRQKRGIFGIITTPLEGLPPPVDPAGAAPPKQGPAGKRNQVEEVPHAEEELDSAEHNALAKPAIDRKHRQKATGELGDSHKSKHIRVSELEAAERWKQGPAWEANSCWVDAPAKAVELAFHAVAERAQTDVFVRNDGSSAESVNREVIHLPPIVRPARRPPSGTSPDPADVGALLERYLLCSKAVRVSTDEGGDWRERKGRLNKARNELRHELRRDELLRKSNKQAQDGWSKQQIEHRVKQLSNQYGSAVNALKLMIRTGGAPDERPNFLSLSIRVLCSQCRQSLEREASGLQSVHPITRDDLQRAKGDVLAAFAVMYVKPPKPSLADEPCPQCECAWKVVERMSPGQVDYWASSPDAPPLLAIELQTSHGENMNVVGEHTEIGRCCLDAGSRDAYTLSTSKGDLTYRLIAAVYYDGSHYITVGRSSQAAVMSASTWVCWDGMHPGAVGVSCAPPTGEPGVLSLEGNVLWGSTFEPHVLLYCRERRDPSGSRAGPSGSARPSGSGAVPSGSAWPSGAGPSRSAGANGKRPSGAGPSRSAGVTGKRPVAQLEEEQPPSEEEQLQAAMLESKMMQQAMPPHYQRKGDREEQLLVEMAMAATAFPPPPPL
jgi:hypothetical protein